MGQASAADLSLRPVITLHVDFLIPYGLVCLDHGNLRPIRSHHLLWQSDAIGCRNASRRRRRRAKRCGWTDLVQVLCQRSTQPGARPLWCVASHPGRPATRSAGNAYKDPPGRGCRHVVTGADRCRHVGTADGACGHMTSRARRRIMAPPRPPHGMLARAVLGHPDDDGQDVVCETGPRQTAVDDTPVATGRPRVVDAPGGGRARQDRRRRDRLCRRGG
jgi:hypothetical protein